MEEVFVDTVAWIALLDEADSLHSSPSFIGIGNQEM
jgi:predicted nucleic acid-binding protein